VFTSDNGATEHHQSVDFVSNNGLRSNGVLRGGKTEVFEGGHRIPFLARLPGTIAPGGTCGHLIALTDMLETCAGLAGVPVPEGASPDGVDCAGSFTDPVSPPARTTLIHDSFFDVVYAIRHHNWKLILNKHAGGFSARRELLPKTRTPGLLYDLDQDPSEQDNLYSQRPEVVNKLIDLFLAEQQAVDSDSKAFT
jgi:arylsulfatase A-like enzyme